HAWMIRAGESGSLFDHFTRGFVAIGWNNIGDLTACQDSEAIRCRSLETYPDRRPGEARNSVAALAKFRFDVAVDDHVMTYSPVRREYLVGLVTSEYLYDPNRMPGYPHLRMGHWGQPISRDALRPAPRNSLGSALTRFSLGEEMWEDVQA